MQRFEVRKGTDEESTVIGLVVASDEIEAISTLQAFKNGFKMTGPGQVGPANAYVEWAHPEIGKLHPYEVSYWRARPLPQ